MLEKNIGNTYSVTSEETKKDLAYTPAAKEFVRKNPGIISQAKKAIDQIISSDLNYFENDSILLEKIGESSSNSMTTRFKLHTKESGEDFFIKINRSSGFHEQGAEEVRIMSDVKVALQNYSDKLVKVVDFVLGYKDSNYAYYIAKFDTSLTQSLDEILEKMPANERLEIKSRVNSLKDYLGNDTSRDYADIWYSNMSYNKQTKEITLYDFRE